MEESPSKREFHLSPQKVQKVLQRRGHLWSAWTQQELLGEAQSSSIHSEAYFLDSLNLFSREKQR